jgi:hypothetical protein
LHEPLERVARRGAREREDPRPRLARPGVYRVEARIEERLGLLSNPIQLR